MNKYQRTAILEILGMTLMAIAIGFTFSVISTYFTLSQILFGLGMIGMSYCGYIIYKIRVDQLKTLDEIRERQSK